MAKRLNGARFTTHAARAKIAEGVHWRGLDVQVHLGYRRGKRGGVWLVRWRVGAGYKQASPGPADDEILQGIFSFATATKAAQEPLASGRRSDERDWHWCTIEQEFARRC